MFNFKLWTFHSYSSLYTSVFLSLAYSNHFFLFLSLFLFLFLHLCSSFYLSLCLFLFLNLFFSFFFVSFFLSVIGGMLIQLLDDMAKSAKGKPMIILNPSLGKHFILSFFLIFTNKDDNKTISSEAKFVKKTYYIFFSK